MEEDDSLVGPSGAMEDPDLDKDNLQLGMDDLGQHKEGIESEMDGLELNDEDLESGTTEDLESDTDDLESGTTEDLESDTDDLESDTTEDLESDTDDLESDTDDLESDEMDVESELKDLELGAGIYQKFLRWRIGWVNLGLWALEVDLELGWCEKALDIILLCLQVNQHKFGLVAKRNDLPRKCLICGVKCPSRMDEKIHSRGFHRCQFVYYQVFEIFGSCCAFAYGVFKPIDESYRFAYVDDWEFKLLVEESRRRWEIRRENLRTKRRKNRGRRGRTGRGRKNRRTMRMGKRKKRRLRREKRGGGGGGSGGGGGGGGGGGTGSGGGSGLGGGGGGGGGPSSSWMRGGGSSWMRGGGGTSSSWMRGGNGVGEGDGKRNEEKENQEIDTEPILSIEKLQEIQNEFEKEKEKKAAAAGEEKWEMKTDTAEPKEADRKSKGPEKKMSKQVMEIHEVLARRKEAKERKKRDGEERIRKEEEEQKGREELGRQAEEARRRKKEKGKEKLLMKKQEVKLLTGKQKEEACRVEAMRNHILANAVIPPPSGDKERAPADRPTYRTKKSKPAHHQANGAASCKMEENIDATAKDEEQQEILAELESEETDKVGDAESQTVVEKPAIDEAPKENGMEEDDNDEEWDAKSWDEVNLNVEGAFGDEENESSPERPVKEKIKKAVRADSRVAKPAVGVKKSPEAENKKNQSEFKVTDKTRKKVPSAKYKAPTADATPKQVEENLRPSIYCIMGHVDTGKTKLLDCIQATNVQEAEAGGITQRIGATYFPAENICERTEELKADVKLKVPGLLVIHHSSFTNLRSRGSGQCDVAILIVYIMHGLGPQTVESLNLLKMRSTEFVVVLNKVDRLYGWKTCCNAPIVEAMKLQSKDVQSEFNLRLVEIITQFKERGLNTELCYKNKETGETFSIVPMSAISGEVIPDLLFLLVQWAQRTMVEKLTFRNEVQCTMLEVKAKVIEGYGTTIVVVLVIEGYGTTIVVVLVNGALHEGDRIVACGSQGPIVTSIRALLTTHPMKELRAKMVGSSSEEQQKMFGGLLMLKMSLSATFQGGQLMC